MKFLYSLILFAFANPVFAATFSPELLKKANSGDAVAQYELAMAYVDGDGVTKNLQEAKKWLEKSGNNGNTDAQYYLGEVYLYSIKDYPEAFRWFNMAANGGDVEAIYSVGCMYNEGLGVEKNMTKANEYFLKGAEKGHIDCMFNLANHYHAGKGCSPDNKASFKWREKAAEANHPGAQYNLGWMYYEGEGCTQNIPKAIDLFTKAADNGYAYASFVLGESFYEGKLFESGIVDYDRSFKYLTKFLEDSKHFTVEDDMYAVAYQLLSKCYRFGRGVEKDLYKANEYQRKAEAYGNPDAKTLKEILGIE